MAEETKHTKAEMAPDADPAPVPGEPSPLPPTAEALAGKAKDLQALRDAVVDAASVGAGLWFSYLFVLFYLLIAVGGVTHQDLFLESPVTLPFLNVDLPLLGFFVLGPLIFLIVHAYVLLHFVLLAGKVGDFDAELRVQIADEEVRKRLRRQLPSNIFVQFLAGSREVRKGVMGFLLRAIAWISLVLGPIALLVFFQLQFLPYHHEAISWWHRIAVAADIVLLWMLWPAIVRGERAGLSWRDLRRGKILALALASLAPVLLVVTIATIPQEWPQKNLPSLRFILWPDEKDKPWRWTSLHELLVAGEVEFAARKPKSLWSNRLVLPGFDAIDHAKFDSEAKIEAVSETISLRARHLEGAVLIGAKLRKADFTGALLQRAQLIKSDLRGARFECGNTQKDPPQQCAQLQGASLIRAQLQGATLVRAQLRRATLDFAQLEGATLDFAQLQGASLTFAGLQGAALNSVGLQGAQLDSAKLQGAQLESARLLGASLVGAHLQGASLEGAHLEGANLSAYLQVTSLDLANLSGASLHQADLKGASLTGTSLKGASLFSTNFQGALLDNVWVWKVDRGWADLKDAWVKGVRTEQMSGEEFEDLRKMIADEVPEGDMRRLAMERIEELDPGKPWKEQEDMAKLWQASQTSDASDPSEVYKPHLARIWKEIGCAAEGAPYVIRGILRQFSSGSPFIHWDVGFVIPGVSTFAAAFLDEERCPGAHGLTDAEKAKLKEIRDRSSPPAPKP